MPTPPILSQRDTERIEELFAVVACVNGVEGVVRRDTPSGTQPWITDDGRLAGRFLDLARASSGCQDAYVVRFVRAKGSP